MILQVNNGVHAESVVGHGEGGAGGERSAASCALEWGCRLSVRAHMIEGGGGAQHLCLWEQWLGPRVGARGGLAGVVRTGRLAACVDRAGPLLERACENARGFRWRCAHNLFAGTVGGAACPCERRVGWGLFAPGYARFDEKFSFDHLSY